MSPPRIAVVTPNWNGGQLAVESARSILAQSVGPRLILVDNGSVDGSSRAIIAAHPEVELIQNDRNLGYSAATNQGLRRAVDCDFVLLVNNDVVFEDPRALEVPLQLFESDPEVHGACGRLLYPDGRFQRFYNALPTAFDLAIYWGFGRHVPGLLRWPGIDRYLCLDVDFSRRARLEQPAFSCVMMRRASASAVGELDEELPIFFNDVDYCWRWRARGWSWEYLPTWNVVHHQSATTKKLGKHLGPELAGSISHFASRHFSPAEAMLVRSALLGEAAWRKYRHGERAWSLRGVWRGDRRFIPSRASIESADGATA